MGPLFSQQYDLKSEDPGVKPRLGQIKDDLRKQKRFGLVAQFRG